MALLDHFTRNAGTEPGDNGFFRIPSHQFTDTLFFWAIGQQGVTRQVVIDLWSLTELPILDADTIQLDAMKAAYVAAATLADKQEYIHRVESSLRLLEQGLVTTGQAETFMSL